MRSSLDAALDHVLAHEGGWANDPQDPGGCTMRGITLNTFRANGHPAASCATLRRSSVAEARRIYTVAFWPRVSGDALPPGVDLLVFDHGVNAGPARAVTLLRQAVGVAARVPLAQVLAAVERVYGRGPAALVRTLAERREGYYRSLKQFPRYGRGWLRRVAAAEQAALDLVAADLRAAAEAR